MRENWTIALLPEVCDILDNLRKPVNSQERNRRIQGKYTNELFPYYGATGQVGYIDDFLTDGDYVLIGEDAAPFLDYTKDVAFMIGGKTWVNNHAHILKSYFNDKFLCHYLNQFRYKDYVTGTTRLKLTQGAMRRMQVKLAPLPEQRTIVAKIEQLFSELDNGIRNFKTAQDQLKIYRQAVLKKAFEGELTKEWRAKQTNLPTAQDLLQQIKEEREKHYQKQLIEWKQAVKDWEANGKVGKKPGNPKAMSSSNHFTEDDLKDLPRIPNNWSWSKSGNLFVYVTSGSRGWAQYYSDAGGIFIRITNLNFDTLKVDLSPKSIQYVTPPVSAEGIRTRVQEGDFLFSITGYLGMFAIAPKLNEAYVNQHISLARPSKMNTPKYLGFWIISKTGGHYYLNQKSKGAIKAGLGLNDIQEFPIPICSVQEQHQIVQEIESRLSVCDKMEESIQESLLKAEALRQSILKQAFEGKLLSEAELAICRKEADWEPAEVLLGRIKKEKSLVGKK